MPIRLDKMPPPAVRPQPPRFFDLDGPVVAVLFAGRRRNTVVRRRNLIPAAFGFLEPGLGHSNPGLVRAGIRASAVVRR
ncbi:hypothetical protein D9M71_790680 [compost metagenome]